MPTKSKTQLINSLSDAVSEFLDTVHSNGSIPCEHPTITNLIDAQQQWEKHGRLRKSGD